MSDDIEPPNNVGYKRPPSHTRFKAGQSGNPKGRPRGAAKSPLDQLMQELESKVDVTENGMRRKITKLEAIAKRLVNSALGGNSKSMDMLMKVLPILEQQHVSMEGPKNVHHTFTWLPAQPLMKKAEETQQ